MTLRHEVIDIVFCASSDPTTRNDLEADLVALAEGAFMVRSVASAAELAEAAEATRADDGLIPLVFVDRYLNDASGIDTLLAMADNPALCNARKVLLADNPDDAEVEQAAEAGALDGTLTVPWSISRLQSLVSRLVTQFFIAEAPLDVDEVADVVDVDVLSKAFVQVEERAKKATERLERLQRSFLDDRTLTDDEVEALVIKEIDRALDNPPRTTVAAGTRILSVGERVDGIRVVVSGRVHLTLDVDGHSIGFHARTAGRVIGLNTIARAETGALFNVEAMEETTFITLTLEQLDEALRHSPTLAIHLVSLLLRGMSRRNQRSIELRLQVDKLARDLERDRDQLAATLDRLNRTQARLVESEKLATLGQLAAGIGHELNNPAAVVSRAADFVTEDLEALTAGVPGAEVFVNSVRDARQQEPMSTRRQRELRNELAAAIGDISLARRLVQIGIYDEESYRNLFADYPDPELQLDRIERLHRIGTTLRNLDAAAQRIVKLVGSLRSYSRSSEVVEEFDVRTGIEETLLLLGHDLAHVEVETNYADDVPTVTGYPGDLNQVWTNLITNAIQAMEEDGARLGIDVAAVANGQVQIRVTDNGHGIPEDDLERIFEPAFTTKAGRVEFGLGLGLQIVKDIVVRHGGSITVESKPGRTSFTVALPGTSSIGDSQ